MEEKILRVENIIKNYGKTEVLKGVSFEIKKGETVGLVGVNGSGKSTLIEILCGVKKQNSGHIDGIINNCKNIGYMPQSFSLFNDLTVKDNLKYFALVYDLKEEVVNKTLEKCFLKEKQNFLCSKLSGGYKQLVSLAVATIHNPKLLLLDEPTSAMDPLFRSKFWEIIKNYLKNGGTVLVTTHYAEEIAECSRLMVLLDGKIVINDLVKNIYKKNENISISELICNRVEKKNEI